MSPERAMCIFIQQRSRPLLAPFGHAEAVATCLLLGEERTLLRSAPRSEFDPTATSARSIIPPRRVQKGPGRCRGLKFAGDRKLDHYLPMAGPPPFGHPPFNLPPFTWESIRALTISPS